MSGTGCPTADSPPVALREWAVVCAAVAAGRQAVLFRKGGLADPGGQFQLRERQFWMLPGTFHPRRDQIRADAGDVWEAGRALVTGERTCLPACVEVVATGRLDSPEGLAVFDGFHVFGPELLKTRFDYRRPGLTVLVVRAFHPRDPVAIVESDATAGCKSWVTLEQSPLVSRWDAVPGSNELAAAAAEALANTDAT